MKIVVTGTRGIPNIMGGVETHCEELFPRIAAMGNDVTVIRRKSYVRDSLTEWKGCKLVDIETPKKKSFEMGDMFCAMSFLQITASEINDEMLADFLSMDSSQVLSIHMQSIDQNTAIKDVKHKITELDRNKIEEQKKAVRSGYDMDISATCS